MARKAREISIINSYVICFNARENLTFDVGDKRNFLSLLNGLKSDSFELLAYNLKDKAFYLFAFDIKMSIDMLLRKIAVKFAKSYNQRHCRSGKVFADRASTTPAQNYDDVVSMVLRIHELNDIQPTKFCSFKKYFEDSNIDKAFILERFGSEENFYEYSKNKSNVSTDSLQKKFTDNELEEYIFNTYKLDSEEIKNLSTRKKENFVTSLIKLTKASARQISRVTSLPLRFLWDLCKKSSTEERKDGKARQQNR